MTNGPKAPAHGLRLAAMLHAPPGIRTVLGIGGTCRIMIYAGVGLAEDLGQLIEQLESFNIEKAECGLDRHWLKRHCGWGDTKKRPAILGLVGARGERFPQTYASALGFCSLCEVGTLHMAKEAVNHMYIYIH